MGAKLIVRVYPDDRVEVKVEGLGQEDAAKPRGRKLCEKITKRLEADLGVTTDRTYEKGLPQYVETTQEDTLSIEEAGP
jgi:hypothetical protein